MPNSSFNISSLNMFKAYGCKASQICSILSPILLAFLSSRSNSSLILSVAMVPKKSAGFTGDYRKCQPNLSPFEAEDGVTLQARFSGYIARCLEQCSKHSNAQLATNTTNDNFDKI